METVLTGVKPTGAPHLGNYAGAIRPALEHASRADRSIIFIADGHALNSVTDPKELRAHTQEVAAAYLACGLDLERTVFFRQSDVPAIFELSAILACVCPKGLANRAHAYKAAAARNAEAGKEADDGINMGLFGYPILMAADILAFDASVVPVGADQQQHLEAARDLAQRLNRMYGRRTVRVPRLQVSEASGVLPGTDGRKMSKSYGNTIPLLAPASALRKAINRFITDGRRPGTPIEPKGVPLYDLVRGVVGTEAAGEVAAALEAGQGYADVKALAFEALDREIAPVRERYADLALDVDDALARGAERARGLADDVLARVKGAVGLGARPTKAK